MIIIALFLNIKLIIATISYYQINIAFNVKILKYQLKIIIGNEK